LKGTGRNDNAALVYVLGTGRMANPKRKEKGKRFHVRFVLHGFEIAVRKPPFFSCDLLFKHGKKYANWLKMEMRNPAGI
jgi:hypothetical protein